MKKLFFSILFLSVLVLPLAASAQFSAASGELARVGGGTGLSTDFEGSLGKIIAGALSLVGTIFLLLTVYAGYLWMTASGNEDKVTKAKDIATQAIIGMAITLGAFAITTFVTSKLNTGGGSTVAGGSSSGGAGSGSETPAGATCAAQGGACVSAADAAAGGGNPCDPNGVGSSDAYINNQMSGKCGAATDVCCELKPSDAKCTGMGGTPITVASCGKGSLFTIETNIGTNRLCCKN